MVNMTTNTKKRTRTRTRRCAHIPHVAFLIEHGVMSESGKWRQCPNCKLFYPPEAFKANGEKVQ